MITQARVCELFEYDSVSGSLIRVAPTKGYNGKRVITRITSSGYLVTMVDGKTYRVHHLVWLFHHGVLPERIDHKNRIKTDNRIENLRLCNQSQNGGNSKPRVRQYKGVTFCKMTSKWRATITVNYKCIHLGRFATIEEAAVAYNTAAICHFKEFALLNTVTLNES